jgi:hypothetical protein
VQHPFPKLKNIFMLTIESAKGIEIGRKFNYYTYQCIGFQHVFDPYIINFDYVSLTKVIHLYDVKCINKIYQGYNVN